ncbi:hypothetical protein DPMN_173008 [Dreissena polymorpha]|uniref:Uncharacterized protein n=1 Tax=Dreissena polymorpha TaxID=45954 RepID=A0A9D4E4N1_DREPO|nr:hypothetical protein DPMN_173004 [Dreissena polymorpha]KAH3771681.1 hypothetical protein DPMN_173008 [Dreissena polymorpha]
MIADLGLPTLELRRQHSKLLMMHRISYGLLDIPATDPLPGDPLHLHEDMDWKTWMMQWFVTGCHTAEQTPTVTPSSSLD